MESITNMKEEVDNVTDNDGTSDPTCTGSHSVGPSSHKNTVDSDSASGMTLLWGIWELWCDTSAMKSFAVSNVGSMNSRQNKTVQSLRLKPDTWLDSVRSISLFDSAEGFWSLHKCTLLPSQLPHGVSYYIFRKNIAPMWEHEANRRGGKWVIHFTQDIPSTLTTSAPQSSAMQPIDYAWLYLCLSVIGEELPCDEEEICGVTVSCSKPSILNSGAGAGNVKKPPRSKDGWKLCLWTRNADNAEAQMCIARAVRDILNTTVDSVDASHDKLVDAIPSKERDGSNVHGKTNDTALGALDSVSRGVSEDCAAPANVSNHANAALLSGTRMSRHGSVGAQRSMYYMVHREIMQAREDQNMNKESALLGSWCKPRYVL